MEFDELRTYQNLYHYIKNRIPEHTSSMLIMIDEIQEINSWEKAIISLFAEDIGDIIITGSNAHLLSSELATLLTGRYVEIPIFPLSFKEFINFRKHHSKKYIRLFQVTKTPRQCRYCHQ